MTLLKRAQQNQQIEKKIRHNIQKKKETPQDDYDTLWHQNIPSVPFCLVKMSLDILNLSIHKLMFAVKAGWMTLTKTEIF